MSAIRLPSAPRPPSAPRGPRQPSGLPPLAPTPEPAQVVVPPYDPQPPQWVGSNLEWIVWSDLVKRGWKIFGRQRVKGQTSNLAEADCIYQEAIPAPGLNIDKGFFRGDFHPIPGKRGPGPPVGYPNGIVLDPVTDWTHRNAGEDRLRRGILAQNGYLLVWLEGRALEVRPHDLITAALNGSDDSSIDRGER